MTIAVDIIIVLIIALCTFIGYKRGLIKVAVNILGFFLAIIIALLLYTPISNFIIQNTSIKDNIKDSIKGTVEFYVIGEEKEEEEKEETSEPKVMSEYIDDFIEKEKQNVKNGEKEIIANVSDTVATNIIKVAVAIGVFLIAKILLLIIKLFADFIGELPIIGQFNRAGGFIYGLLQGFLITFIILALISIISPSLKNPTIPDAINGSFIGKYMYNNNIILKIIFK